MLSGYLELLRSGSQRAGSSPTGPTETTARKGRGARRLRRRRGSRARSRRDTPEPANPYILTEASTFKSPTNRFCLENALSNDWQKPNPAEASEPVSKAREAAEALFRPKQQVVVDSSNGPTLAELGTQRKPRIIPIPGAEPHREAIAKPRTRRREIGSRIRTISKSEYGRVRVLASHGMTLEQVAALYEVPATHIERIVAPTSDTDGNSSQRAGPENLDSMISGISA
jgi:hypothetical protein